MTFVGPVPDEAAATARCIGIVCNNVDDLESAEPGESLWIAPERYPEIRRFTLAELERIRELVYNGSRIFVEYDVPVPVVNISSRRCNFERFVVRQTDHPVTSYMRPLDLLEAHQAYFQFFDSLPDESHELVSIARVSGFDTAVYGLPEHTFPGIVELSRSENGALLWASTSISIPTFRRYKPISRWTILIQRILLYLTPEYDRESILDRITEMNTEIARRPKFTLTPKNRAEKYLNSITENLEWYRNAGMLIDDSGKKGVLEGLNSKIDIDGTQAYMLHEGKPNERADCNVQSAIAFIEAGKVLDKDIYTLIGKNLLKYSISQFQYRDKSVYSGLWRWFKTGYEKTVFYSDDNGWAGFLTLFHGARFDDIDVIESGLQTAVALRDTWGTNGYRRRRIDLPDFFALDGRKGLRSEASGRALYKSPHYEASAMATMALAALLTGDRSFVDTIAPGLDDYLDKWPNKILFQHSENDDGSKLITALLFAGVAADNKRYIEKARELLQHFIGVQLECGAIPEIDALGNRYGKNRSNRDYGTFESSLFQEPPDVVTDQVYGTSFLLMALYFGRVFFPDDKEVARAMYALADYLVHIQLRDTDRTFLDGAWMRGFDPLRWEYYGAAGDWGYGPYLLETGWCQAIIVLGLSWILDDAFKGDFNDSIKELSGAAVKRIANEQREIEKNWREHTPPPQKHVVNGDAPDLMI